MVGGADARRSQAAVTTDEDLVAAIRAAYEDAAEAWASGPAPVYRHLAEALIACSPSPLAGRDVLDLGAGTGVATESLVAEGAAPVGLDLAHAMLAHRREHRPPGVVADACALPLADGSFDAVVAAFCLNHVPEPVTALAEARRVLRPGGIVLASTYPADADHPAKAAVEEVLTAFGHSRPGWYQAMRERLADLTGDRDDLARIATSAGLRDVRVRRVEVAAGLDRPEVAAAWRLDMPHTVGFVAGLDPMTRRRLHERATAALSGDLPASVEILVLQGRAP
jgi:ubiquinone/menaquinone biosynthesis C-methylase UbiE